VNSFDFENNTCDFSASFKETMEFLNCLPEHQHPNDSEECRAVQNVEQSVDDCVDMLNNRIGTYLSENS